MGGLFGLILTPVIAAADNVLFIGNSFTFGAEAPMVHKNGGVPKLVEEIARAKGRMVAVQELTYPGADWAFHLARPVTALTLARNPWTWVVMQDESLAPTRAGNTSNFMRDGEMLAKRIAEKSPRTGIILYETWARPAGLFYDWGSGRILGNPEEMMREVHQSYAQLRDDLAGLDPARPVRVAPVGTAFARCEAEFPEIGLNARDHHHATAEGYYLAALVIYETIYHDSALGAPTCFFNGQVIIPERDTAQLQGVANEIAATPKG